MPKNWEKNSNTWTPQMVNHLIKLWDEGYSASRIAAQINQKHGSELTRNAVLGKRDRIGLAKRTTPTIGAKRKRSARNDSSTKLAKVKRTQGNPHRALIFYSGNKSQKKDGQPDHSVFKTDRTNLVSIIDVTDDQCKWVFEDDNGKNIDWCGAPASNGSYCRKHALIVYPALRQLEGKKSEEAA